MNASDTNELKSLQSTAAGLPSLCISKVTTAFEHYLCHIESEGKAVDHYKSRLRWFTRWLEASGLSDNGLLYYEDVIAFELWLRSAKSSHKQALVSQPLRQEILKRLRGALRWANVHGHLQHDYSVWVPAAHLDVVLPPVQKDAVLAATYPVITDNNITTANLRTWMGMFSVGKDAEGTAPRTMVWYRSRIDSYLNWVDAHEGLNPTNPVALEFFLAYQQKINSKATVKATFTALRGYFNWLLKRRFIRHEDVPTKIVPAPKVPLKRMRYVTTEEFDTFYGAIGGTTWLDWRDRAIFTILFYSGLRAGELLKLRAEDINRGDKIIHVRHGKGGKQRDVPYAPQLEVLVDRYLELRPPCPTGMYLFLSSDGMNGIRGQIDYDGFKMIMKRRLQISGLPKINLHAFRHGFAMWALNNGMALSAVSKALGHSSVTLTESIYAHWTMNGLKSEYNNAFGRVTSGERIKT